MVFLDLGGSFESHSVFIVHFFLSKDQTRFISHGMTPSIMRWSLPDNLKFNRHRDYPRFIFSTIERLFNPSPQISSNRFPMEKCSLQYYSLIKSATISQTIAGTSPFEVVSSSPSTAIESNMSIFLVISLNKLTQVTSLMNSLKVFFDPLHANLLKTVLNS